MGYVLDLRKIASEVLKLHIKLGKDAKISNFLRFRPRPDLHEGSIETELFPGSKRSMLLCCAYKLPSEGSIHFYDSLLSECDRGLNSANQNLSISWVI